MDIKKLFQEKATKLDNNFDKLILKNKLDINSIEDKDVSSYREIRIFL